MVHQKRITLITKNRIELILKADFVFQYPSILFWMCFHISHITQDSTQTRFFWFVQFVQSTSVYFWKKTWKYNIMAIFANMSQAKLFFLFNLGFHLPFLKLQARLNAFYNQIIIGTSCPYCMCISWGCFRGLEACLT